MASSTPLLTQRHGLLLWPAIAKLARWRFKPMWRFLFVTWLGMLTMVVLVCSGPLFELVANSASVRSQLASAPDGAYITVDAISLHPTREQLQQFEQVTNRTLQQGVLGSYLHAAPQVIVQTPALDMLANNKTTPAAFDLVGYDSTQAAQHITILQGRLPQVTADGTVEIALWQAAAVNLGLHVGSMLQGRFPVAAGSGVWQLRVVSIIAPKTANDPYWAMADPFSKSSVSLSSRYYFKHEGALSYNVFTASRALMPKIAVIQAQPGFSGGDSTNNFVFFLRYPFELAHFDANDLPALSQQITNIDNQFQSTALRNTQAGNLGNANIFGTLWPALEFSSLSSTFGQIAVTFLLLITLALVLFLVSLMSGALVEWQAAIIATLRSRGATRRHIFGAFTVDGIIISVAALLAGPLLAILLVRAMAQTLLSPDNQSAINVITAHPISAALGVKWYALGAVGVALAVLILSLHRATKMDIVSFRRESARPRHVPFWRRFYLDLFLVVLLLAGYIVYTSIWSVLIQSSVRIDPTLYTLLTGVGFFAAPLVIAAVLMLFLRLFPWIVRLATYLVAKKRSAPAVLALAQMERTPRPAARIIVLLALAISSACFLLTLTASQEQRNLDLATFAAQGADFSGSLPPTDTSRSFSQLMSYYSRQPGVQSATLGYQDVIQLSSNQDASGQGAVTVDAVDAATYARTVTWPASYSSAPLSSLTTQLASHRSDGIARNVVYALVDLATWQRLHLTPGAQFALPADSSQTSHITYIALAQINYVPGVHDTPTLAWSGMGLIVDYQNYVAIKAGATGKTSSSFAPNYIWLHTKDDAASLTTVRNLLPGLNDRNQTLATVQTDPNYLGIVGVLYLGVSAALVLALIGGLLLSWLNASNRLTNFAVARALGMQPRQIASVLLWEQGFVYLLALLLGLLLGGILTIFVGPTVGTLPVGSGLDIGFNIPPIQVVIPFAQLLPVLGAVVLSCLVALLLMARVVSRPSLSQTLRLNED
jgi:ABC-type antimicrobial peptide transport system permease subunit